MKMIIAIVQDKDSNRLANEFIEADVRATKLSTTGGLCYINFFHIFIKSLFF